MPDLETAKALLSAAGRDLRALSNMTDEAIFALEIFGFHAQQLVEKSLKAWLSIAGVEYPKTHSIRFLIVLLQQSGSDVSNVWELVTLSAFAAQFRYEAYEMLDEEMDRSAVLRQSEGLYIRVSKLLKDVESGQ